MKRAVVLLSGGLDSSTVLSMAKAEGHELYAVSFDYNQRHRRELESAKLVAAALNVKKHLIVKFDLREIGGSALTSEIEVPKEVRSQKSEARSKEFKNIKRKSLPAISSELPDFRTSGLIPVTYVPARNTIFLSFALGWAEVLESENIFIGANAIDYSGYPDCRPEYLKAFEEMANLATKASVEGKMRFAIRAPLVSMTKSEIIKMGTTLGLDYSLTWSCYDPQPVKAHGSKLIAESTKKNSKEKTMSYDLRANFVPCRLCDSCRLREKGFKEAGLIDPLLVD
ncbi:MAG: 7-cyano-7-deazaguanine synthase QueC [Nitrospirae bacterium GWC2_42_7]|nr:MAG: 7-cyano-7-deazaguanine synthase QueC [Nitrospirae bacterium GWC2_42_7]